MTNERPPETAEELLAIPEFLRRDPYTPDELAAIAARHVAEEHSARNRLRGAAVTSRRNPRRDQAAAARRVVPSRDRRNNRATTKTPKVAYPTTIALKAAVDGLEPAAKRNKLYAIARENDIRPERWDTLNNGQVAMNLGNVIRGRYYKNWSVKIEGKEVS